ncbi:MAG: Hint domain-containing protein, partial [Rhodospirillales bacterium]|nr:Hint domain-containing protein [Rhodospirillales bacterium]
GVVGDHITNATSLTVSGTAEANSTVKLYQDGNLVATGTADASGAWSIVDPHTLSNGTTYHFTATATDIAGNISATSSEYTASIDDTAPTVTSAVGTDGTISAGQTASFVLSIDESTVVDTTATLSLSNGATATYDAGASSATSLVFDYTVASGDAASSDLTITAVNGVTDVAGNALTYSGNPSGTTVILCYLKGTRLMTAHGEVPVETLREGDLMVCRFGGLRPIRWIGHQTIRGEAALGHEAIRFQAGSLGPNMPRHTLFVTQGHSMLVGETLVLARSLVNGVTITEEPPRDAWEYFQIEFDTHDCVLAEGCWSESFADAGTLREQFDNVADFHRRFPGYQPPAEVSLCASRP